MRSALGMLVVATAALLAACAAAPPPPGPDPVPPTATTATAAPDAEVDAAAEATLPEPRSDSATEDANGNATRDAAPAPAPGPPALAAEGTNCNAGSECESGICEGAGCDDGDGDGVCVSKTRACSTKLAWYCGCDGKSLQASADCPGMRFAYQARCTPAKAWSRGAAPDWASCLKASQCKSGVCEGHGCDDAHPGTCQPAMRGCGQSAVQYCGCDGRSFSSNPCPGVRYESTGVCPIDPKSQSQIKVLSVSGKSAAINAELKSALVASGLLRRCHVSSGEKTFTTTLDFEVDAKGQVRVIGFDGLGQRGSVLPGCINAFGRRTTLKATGSAARVSVKLRFELTRSKP